jgi:hypothetical protein
VRVVLMLCFHRHGPLPVKRVRSVRPRPAPRAKRRLWYA